MKTASCKAKGRNLQNHIVTRILEYFKELTNNDCSSRSMGAAGDDILLSEKARQLLYVSIEAKSNAKHRVYSLYEQAKANASIYQPILIIKQNNSKPLAIMDLDYWLNLERIRNDKA